MESIALFETRRADEIRRVRGLLDDAGIPYRIDMMHTDSPLAIFFVARSRLFEARAVIDGEGDGTTVDTRDRRLLGDLEDRPFPKSAWHTALALIGLHLLLVAWMLGPIPPGRELLEWGALVKGGTLLQPWRLPTSILLHVDFRHALANGVSMAVFGIPLLAYLGTRRTALIYFSAGLGGAMTALAFAEAGNRIVGSSGAVAGLFGAWIVVAVARIDPEKLVRRERMKIAGVSLLFLFSLLSPVTSTGQSVSVSSHLGGLTTGAAIGVLVSRGILARWARAIRENRVAEPR